MSDEVVTVNWTVIESVFINIAIGIEYTVLTRS